LNAAYYTAFPARSVHDGIRINFKEGGRKSGRQIHFIHSTKRATPPQIARLGTPLITSRGHVAHFRRAQHLLS
jgi:hypothetical protein